MRPQLGPRYNSAASRPPYIGRLHDALMTPAAVRRLSIPLPDELVERACAMVPEIRALAQETERNRNLFPHIVEKIRDAELFAHLLADDVRRL